MYKKIERVDSMDKKGFTLLELLATVIILGLLTTIVVSSVLPLLNKSNNEYYANQEKMLILAAKDYFTDYRSKLPKEVGETSTVTLKELINGKYIDPIKDRNEKDCNYEKSSVVVQKITEKEYQYYVTLICEEDNNYQSEEDNTLPTIAFNPNKKSSTGKVNVKIIYKDNKKVASYRYVIEKEGVAIEDSGYKTYKEDPTITLTDKGTYKIKGYAIDTGGNMKEESSGIYEIYEGISCETVKYTSNTKTSTWTKNNITVNIEVPTNTYRYEVAVKKDSGAYEIKNTYIGAVKSTIILTETGKHTIKVTAYDSAGNSCSRESGTYYIDKTAPSCGKVTGESKTWTNKDRTISVECNDSGSGCKENSVSKKFTSNTKTETITIEDNVGNTKKCNVNVYIDKDKPYYTLVKRYCGRWSGNRFRGYIKLSYADDFSGLGIRKTSSWDIVGTTNFPNINYQGASKGEDNMGTGNLWIGYSHTICDLANNCVSSSKNKIDLSDCPFS